MIDTIQIVIFLESTQIPDTPVILYALNNAGDTSINIGWQNDPKAYKYVIYQSPNNVNYIAVDTAFSPAVSINIKNKSTEDTPKYYFQILSYNGNDSPSSDSSMILGMQVTPDTPEVLLVEDDFSIFPHGFINKFVGSISYAGRSFDCVLSSGIKDGSINMKNYRNVIWSCGNDSKDTTTSLNNVEIDKIKDFLDNGGNLFLSGSEIGADLNVLDPEFYTRYLKAVFKQNDSLRFTLNCAPSGILSGCGSDTFYIWTDDAGSSQGDVTSGAAYKTNAPDITEHSSANTAFGGKTTLKFWDSGLTAGIDFTGGYGIDGDDSNPYLETSEKISKLIYFTFPFECIHDLNARRKLMTGILTYFDSSSVAGRITLDDTADWSGCNIFLIKSAADSSSTTSDSFGRFRFDYVKTGAYHIEIAKTYYTTFISNSFTLTDKIDTLVTAKLYKIYNDTPNIIARIFSNIVDSGTGFNGDTFFYIPGAKIQYIIEYENIGTDTAFNLTLTHILPLNTLYDTNSIAIDTDISDGINYISYTDATDTDFAEYNILQVKITGRVTALAPAKICRLSFFAYIE